MPAQRPDEAPPLEAAKSDSPPVDAAKPDAAISAPAGPPTKKRR
jgi:hypothetical protein